MPTEEEAAEMWCPMVRADIVSGPAINRLDYSDNPLECRCIASRCMMWRLDQSSLGDRGYCGLAGKPAR